MSPIWRSLEIVGSGALTLPHWQKGLGADDLALLRPFLSPRAEPAAGGRSRAYTHRGSGPPSDIAVLPRPFRCSCSGFLRC